MSKSTDNKLKPVRTIRLSRDQIAAILDEMDVEPAGGHIARRDSRYKYRLQEVVVLMQQPGVNAPMAYLVPTRNISARGLSFLHGGFVHPGTLCVVQLLTARGGQQNVVGAVRRCRYIQNNIHEVAVHFKSAIDPAAFCRDAVSLHALVAEDDAALAKLCKHHLVKLHCQVAFAADAPAVMELVSQSRFDLILLDMDLPPTNGCDVARDLRARGFGGLIIAGTGTDDAELKNQALQAGCDLQTVKPFGHEALAQAIASLQSEPLFSAFHDDPAMNELVAEFVDGLPRKIRSLEQALSSGDMHHLQTRLAELKAESRGFGFREIAENCQKAEQALRDNAGQGDLSGHVRTVVRMCAQARGAPKAGLADRPAKAPLTPSDATPTPATATPPARVGPTPHT